MVLYPRCYPLRCFLLCYAAWWSHYHGISCSSVVAYPHTSCYLTANQSRAMAWAWVSHILCLIRCLPWCLLRAKHMSGRRTSFQNPACRSRLYRGLPASPRPDIADSRHAFWLQPDPGYLDPSPPTIRHLSATPGSALYRQAKILEIRLKGRGRGVNWVTGARET